MAILHASLRPRKMLHTGRILILNVNENLLSLPILNISFLMLIKALAQQELTQNLPDRFRPRHFPLIQLDVPFDRINHPGGAVYADEFGLYGSLEDPLGRRGRLRLNYFTFKLVALLHVCLRVH